MTQVCPIIDKQVDEKVTRLNALLTFLIALLYIFTPFKEIIFFLAFDFLLRSFNDGKYSPFKAWNRYFARIIGLQPLLINAGPKIFAARIGLTISLIISLTYIFGFNSISILFAGIIGFFAFLESAFGFCVACKIYPFFYRS